MGKEISLVVLIEVLAGKWDLQINAFNKLVPTFWQRKVVFNMS